MNTGKDINKASVLAGSKDWALCRKLKQRTKYKQSEAKREGWKITMFLADSQLWMRHPQFRSGKTGEKGKRTQLETLAEHTSRAKWQCNVRVILLVHLYIKWMEHHKLQVLVWLQKEAKSHWAPFQNDQLESKSKPACTIFLCLF